MKFSQLISGLCGALFLTAVHETLRVTLPQAPRMDRLGKEGLTKILSALNVSPPQDSSVLHTATLAGDILANTLYYSLIPMPPAHKLWTRSWALGLLAGSGALVLPRPLGLNPKHSNRAPKTQVLTVAYYLSGALVTALTFRTIATENRTLAI